MSYAREQWLDEVVMRPLVADDVLVDSDRLYMPFRAHAELAALIDLAHPGTNELTLFGTPTFTPDVGFTCDAVDDQLVPGGYEILTTYASTLLKQDSAHFWARASGLQAANAAMIGQSSGTTVFMLRRNSSGQLDAFLSGPSVNFGAVPAAGVYGISRVGAGAVRGFLNGVLLSEQVSVSAPPAADRSLRLMRTGTTYTAGVFEAAGMGRGLTDAQHATIAAVCAAAAAEAPPA